MSDRTVRDILRDLPVLAELRQTGSITAAADELGIPQPSASRSLSRLAGRTGIELVSKSGRGIVLTPAGESLAVAAINALTAVEDGLAAARRNAEAIDSLVTIAYQTVLGESFLPQAIARYRTRNPTARFKLFHGAREHCIEMVQATEADIAVIADPPETADFSRTVLYSEPLYAVVAATHELAQRLDSVTPVDLLQFDLIVLGPGYGLHNSVLRIFESDQMPPHTFEVDDYRVARGLAAAGVGVTILPPREPGVDTVTVDIPIRHQAAQRTIGAVTRHHSATIATDFLDALRATARQRRRVGSVD